MYPKEGKIETNKFLVFSLAALGIYKGRDEKIIEHCSNITPKFKSEEEKENEENNNNEENQNPKVSNININNNPPKKQMPHYFATKKNGCRKTRCSCVFHAKSLSH